MIYRMTDPLKLYWHPLSGHAHRAELMLSLLGLPFERIEVDLLRGAQKRPEFLAKNAFGQVPVIEDGAFTLADSCAILVYLALRYDASGSYLPRDPAATAETLRWLSVAAGPLYAGPASLRLAALFRAPVDRPRAQALTEQLFAVLEGELSERPYLVGRQATIADVALYTYSAHAPEGGVALEPYPKLREWLARIEALPGFVGMRQSVHPGGSA